MATGLGGFAQGFSQGFNNMAQIGLAARKDEREQALFGLQKSQLERQERDAQAEEDAKNDVKNTIADLQKQRKGGFSGEVLDENGQSLGVKTIHGDEQYVNEMLSSQGYSFKPETVKPVDPIDDIKFKRGVAGAIVSSGYKTGKVDLKALEDQEKFYTKLETEGVNKALDYFRRTGDKEGMFKIFDKYGTEKAEQFKDIDFRVEADDFGSPNVVGYRAGKDGKPVKVFDEFTDVILPSLSPDQKATIVNSNKQLAIKESNENKRLGYSEGGKDRRALWELQGKANNKDKEPGWIIDLQKTTIANIKDDPTKRLRAGEYEMAINEAGALARRLVTEKSLDANTAWSIATQEAYSRRGLVAPTVKPKQ